ncbi:MAG: hypothetical protein J5617_00555 [Bacilli bacterium]|nr:hypothetical protein [Bacilli bacterium]
MNIKALKEQLLEMGKGIGLQVQEEKADSLTLHAQIIAKDYFDNSIYFRAVIFSSGTLHVFLTFDEIERTYDNLYLINAFNSENPWFRAYITSINDKDYLELHYTSVALEKETEVVDTIGFLLNELLNDNTLKYLNPILATKIKHIL